MAIIVMKWIGFQMLLPKDIAVGIVENHYKPIEIKVF